MSVKFNKHLKDRQVTDRLYYSYIKYSANNVDYLFIEINTRIEESRKKLMFINKLRCHSEFTYFIKNDNPQLGKLTYLRFL